EELQAIYLTAERPPLAGEGKGAGRASGATGQAKAASSTSPVSPASSRRSHPGGVRLSRSRPRP
ncbi:MAG: hypothetical protein ACKOZW_08620, partial [Cyanobium sp.]